MVGLELDTNILFQMQHFSYNNVCAFTEIYFTPINGAVFRNNLVVQQIIYVTLLFKVTFGLYLQDTCCSFQRTPFHLTYLGVPDLELLRLLPFIHLHDPVFLASFLLLHTPNTYAPFLKFPDLGPVFNTAYVFCSFPNSLCLDNSYCFSSKLSLAISSLKTSFLISTNIQ